MSRRGEFKKIRENRVGKKAMNKLYETAVEIEDDCLRAIGLAKQLRTGILKRLYSEEHQMKMCDEIVAVLEA